MIQYGGRTDVGRRRARNEDSILVGERILVVCDGMGGHQAGDVASRIGVDTVGAFVSRSEADPELTWPYGFDPSVSFDANRIRTAIKLANRAIYTRAAAEDEYAGMGTTIVATIVGPDDDPRFTYGHVGDSRLYLVRGGRMVQLTRDDSLANSAWADADSAVGTVMKNVLTKALGVRPEVEFDVAAHDLLAGDIVLLCSDGLTNMLDDQAILEIVARDDEHLEKTCDELVAAANARGGRDNISVLLLRYRP
ncbi:MAG TPA: PP2C family serine/threonine-protein phosphatase [Methylomirabilota bacterium]|jgi:protein phosphatase